MPCRAAVVLWKIRKFSSLSIVMQWKSQVDKSWDGGLMPTLGNDTSASSRALAEINKIKLVEELIFFLLLRLFSVSLALFLWCIVSVRNENHRITYKLHKRDGTGRNVTGQGSLSLSLSRSLLRRSVITNALIWQSAARKTDRQAERSRM